MNEIFIYIGIYQSVGAIICTFSFFFFFFFFLHFTIPKGILYIILRNVRKKKIDYFSKIRFLIMI